MFGEMDEHDVLNSIKGIHAHGTHDRAWYHEHHGNANEHVVIDSVALLAFERCRTASHVRSRCGQNECGGRTKSAEYFFSKTIGITSFWMTRIIMDKLI